MFLSLGRALLKNGGNVQESKLKINNQSASKHYRGKGVGSTSQGFKVEAD